MRESESEMSASPPSGFRHQECRYRVPLFRQGGVTVGLTTRLRAERDQGGFILIGRFVEAIRETSIRRDILSILLLR